MCIRECPDGIKKFLIVKIIYILNNVYWNDSVHTCIARRDYINVNYLQPKGERGICIVIDLNLNSKTAFGFACRAMAGCTSACSAMVSSIQCRGIVTNFLHRYNNSKRKRKNIFRAAGRRTYAWRIKWRYHSRALHGTYSGRGRFSTRKHLLSILYFNLGIYIIICCITVL